MVQSLFLEFVDEKKLLDCIGPLQTMLSSEEAVRNTLTQPILYTHQSHSICKLISTLQEPTLIDFEVSHGLQGILVPTKPTNSKDVVAAEYLMDNRHLVFGLLENAVFPKPVLPKESKPTSVEQYDRRLNNMLCYKCGKFGHFSKDCNEVEKAPKCFVCGNVGHLARNCPTKQ